MGLLALIIILAWPNLVGSGSNDDSKNGRPGASSNGARSGAETASRSGKSHRSKSSGKPRPDPTHSVEQLKDFYLPGLQSDGCTLREALEMALDEYYRVATLTNEVPHSFSFEIDGTPDGPIHFVLSGRTFWQSIDHLAALAGMEVAERGPPIVLVAVEDNGTKVTKSLAVPPNFASAIANPRNLPNDPFSEPAPPPRIEDSLRELGILLTPDSTVSYDPRTSMLTVTASARDQHRVTSLQEANSLAPVLYKMTTQIVEAPAGAPPAAPRVYAPEEAQEVVSDLMESQGDGIISLPSLTTRPGQRGRLEIGDEVVTGPDEIEFVGRRMDLIVSPTGFELETRISALLSERLESGEIAARELVTSSMIPPGSSLVLQTERPNGGSQLVILTPTILDSSGRQIVPAAAPITDDNALP